MDAAPEEPHPHPTRRDAEGMPLPVHPAASCHVFFFFSHSGRNSKKKKEKVQNTPFELNNIPYFSSSAHFIQTPSSLTLSHSVTRLSLSLCSCLPASISALRLPCGCETLSQTATQSLQTPKFSSLSILWVVFNLLTSCFSYYLVLLLNLVYVYIM